MDKQLNKGLIELQEKLKELTSISEYIKQSGIIAENAAVITQNVLKKHEEILNKIDEYVSYEENRIMDVSLILSNKLANKFEEFNEKNHGFINSSTNKSTNAIEKTQSVLEKGVSNFEKTQNQILNNLQVSKTKFDTFLIETQNKIQNEFKIINQNQSSLIKEIERSKKGFDEILNISKMSISGELKNIKSNQEKVNSNFSEVFGKTATKLKSQVSEIEEALVNKFDTLRQTNIQNYKDLESILRVKLEDNKSEIKRLIENERQQVKTIVEKNIEELSKKITEKQKVIQNSIWIVGSALALLNIIIMIKLFA